MALGIYDYDIDNFDIIDRELTRIVEYAKMNGYSAGNLEKEQLLRFVVDKGYISNKCSIELRYYLQDNLKLLPLALRINMNYINCLQNRRDIERNLNLICQLIDNGAYITSEDILKYLCFFVPEDKKNYFNQVMINRKVYQNYLIRYLLSRHDIDETRKEALQKKLLKIQDKYNDKYTFNYENIKDDIETLKEILDDYNRDFDTDYDVIFKIRYDINTITKLVENGYAEAIDFLDSKLLLKNKNLYMTAIKKGYSINQNTPLDFLNDVNFMNAYLDGSNKSNILWGKSWLELPELLHNDHYIHEMIMWNREILSDEYFLNYCHNHPYIERYIEFIKQNNMYYNNLLDISIYFDENGPTKELYELALFDPDLFNILFKDAEWEKVYRPSVAIKQYIDFINKQGFLFVKHINSVKDINKYFDVSGNFTQAFADLALSTGYIFRMYSREQNIIEKLNYSTKELACIKYINKFPSLRNLFWNSSSIMDNINIYIDANGQFTPALFEVVLSNGNIVDFVNKDSSFINNYRSDKRYEKIKKYIDLLRNPNYRIEWLYDYLDYVPIDNNNTKDDLFILLLSFNCNCIPIVINDNFLDKVGNSIGIDTFSHISRLTVKDNSYKAFVEMLNNNAKLFMIYYNRLFPMVNKYGEDAVDFPLLLAAFMTQNPNEFPERINLRKKVNLELLAKVYGIHRNDRNIFYKNGSNNMVMIKNTILQTITGMNYNTFKHLMTYHINKETIIKIKTKIETKLKILYKSKDINALEEIQQLEVNRQNVLGLYVHISFLNRYVNSSLSYKQLLDISNILLDVEKENPDIYDDYKLYFLMIMKHIRRVYEIDANLTLTPIGKAITEVSGIDYVYEEGQKIKYYDFSQYEYTLYAHTDPDVNSLFNSRYVGNQALCLSPISNLGNKGYYDNNIIYGYDYLPKDSFIASSIRNTGSNSVIGPNNVNFDLMNSNAYIQLEIKESSSRNPNYHSETNVLRSEDLRPSCVIMRNDEPTIEEIKAAIELGKLLGLSEPAPLIKTQPINTIVNNPKYFSFSIYNDIKCNSSGSLADLSQEYFKALNYETPNINIQKTMMLDKALMIYGEIESKYRDDINKSLVGISKREELGSSHDIYSAHIGSTNYIIKPSVDKFGNGVIQKAYASEAVANIQKLVNPDNVVAVSVQKVDLGNGQPVLCSVLEKKENVIDFANEFIHNLSLKQIEAFLREMIVDYLTYSYDTKGPNFLRDLDNEHIYGIDKEQALMHATQEYQDDRLIPKNIPGNTSGPTMYKALVTYINEINKNSTDLSDIINKITDTINEIMSMDDEQYLNVFSKYRESVGDLNRQKEIARAILYRKYHLLKEWLIFLNDTLSFEKIGPLEHFKSKEVTK